MPVSYTHLDVYKRQTLFDLIKFAYGDHLYGDETCPSWVEAATANMRLAGSDSEGNPTADGSLISLSLIHIFR